MMPSLFLISLATAAIGAPLALAAFLADEVLAPRIGRK